MLPILERRILEQLKQSTFDAAAPRALTVAELGDALRVDRHVLDHALGNLDDAGLIRIRGDVSTSRSYVELIDGAERPVADSERRSA